MKYKKDIKYYKSRYDALLSERSTWERQWHDCAYYSLPNAYQLMTGYSTSSDGQVEYKGRAYEDIISTIGYEAVDVFVSGMQNAASPASRPWVKVRLVNSEEDQRHDVKQIKPIWQSLIQDTISQRCAYSVAQMYANIFVFGTSCTLLEFDANNILRAVDVPVGSYCLSENQHGVVDTVYRSFKLKAGEAYRVFGDKVSDQIKNCVDKGYIDNYFDFVHAVEPNNFFAPLTKQGKEFDSVYFEVGSNEILRKGGYDRFPYACPRWNKSPTQVYGISPVMRALPSLRMLQHLCKNVTFLKDQVAHPVVLVDPAIIETADKMMIPLGTRCIAGFASDVSRQPVTPIITVNPSSIQVEQDERDRQEARVNNSLYVNLFQMLSMQDNIRTATEILEMKNEALSLIAPKTQSLHNEGLKKFSEEAFYALLESGRLPLPAEQITGGIEIEFDSILTQAQKMSGLGATQKALEVIGQAMQIAPLAQGKIDQDKIVDLVVDQTGVDPIIIRSQQEVDMARQAQAEVAQQQQQMAMAEQAAKATQTLSNSNLENLSQMIGGMNG